jgi:hypothetical protein
LAIRDRAMWPWLGGARAGVDLSQSGVARGSSLAARTAATKALSGALPRRRHMRGATATIYCALTRMAVGCALALADEEQRLRAAIATDPAGANHRLDTGKMQGLNSVDGTH